MRYTLGCDLAVDIKQPTTFIFNFEVTRLVRRHDLIDTLMFTPDLPQRTYIVRTSGKDT